MSSDTDLMQAVEDFIADEVIDEVVALIKPGKEGVVYLARKHGDPPRLFAVKVYRDTQHRSFRRDETYRQGRSTLDERLDRAMEKGSRTGRQARAGLWVQREQLALRTLYMLGANVPRFVAASGNALLMEFLGDEDGPAPTLNETQLSPAEAEQAFEQLVRNLELMLDAGLIHADLSPYNILYWHDAPWIIDFPQSVDLYVSRYLHEQAPALLARDVTNICTFFGRRGVEASPREVFARLEPVLPEELSERLQALPR